MTNSVIGSGRCSVDVFYDLFAGLLQRQWSGLINIKMENNVKRVYLQNGEIVFARSSLIDDRLGEVIYRNGKINVEQLFNSATQVTRQKRFGQVLLSSQIFNHLSLWYALQDQIKFIIRSIFMFNEVEYEFQNLVAYDIQLGFEEPKLDLLNNCYSYGCLYRDFVKRIDFSGNPKILLSDFAERQIDSLAGTFVGDMLSLAQSKVTLDEFINGSKLQRFNTLAALMEIYKIGLCFISPIASPSELNDEFCELKTRIEGYNELVQSINEACNSAEVAFPSNEVKAMADKLNSDGLSCLYLGDYGNITAESCQDMLTICRSIFQNEKIVLKKVDYLSKFLLQMADDRLPRASMTDLQNCYRKIIEKIQKIHSYSFS